MRRRMSNEWSGRPFAFLNVAWQQVVLRREHVDATTCTRNLAFGRVQRDGSHAKGFVAHFGAQCYLMGGSCDSVPAARQCRR